MITKAKTSKILSCFFCVIVLFNFAGCSRTECRIQNVSRDNDMTSVHTNLTEGENILIIELDQQDRTVRSWTGNVDSRGMLEIKTGEIERNNRLICEYCK